VTDRKYENITINLIEIDRNTKYNKLDSKVSYISIENIYKFKLNIF